MMPSKHGFAIYTILVLIGIVTKSFFDEITKTDKTKNGKKNEVIGSENVLQQRNGIPPPVSPPQQPPPSARELQPLLSVLPDRQRKPIWGPESQIENWMTTPTTPTATTTTKIPTSSSGKKTENPKPVSMSGCRQSSLKQDSLFRRNLNYERGRVEHYTPIVNQWNGHPMIAHPPIFNGESRFRCLMKGINRDCQSDLFSENRFLEDVASLSVKSDPSDRHRNNGCKPNIAIVTHSSDDDEEEEEEEDDGNDDNDDFDGVVKDENRLNNNNNYHNIMEEDLGMKRTLVKRTKFLDPRRKKNMGHRKNSSLRRNFFLGSPQFETRNPREWPGADNPLHVLRRLEKPMQPMTLVRNKMDNDFSLGDENDMSNRKNSNWEKKHPSNFSFPKEEADGNFHVDFKKKGVSGFHCRSQEFRHSLFDSIKNSKAHLWNEQRKANMLTYW